MLKQHRGIGRIHERGITLIELMVVVAIIGILAAIGSIAYGRYIKSAKVEKLRQYAMEVASGQERYRARNNAYWAGGTYAAEGEKFANLLDFSKQLPAGIEIETVGWAAGGTCGDVCDGAPTDETMAGFAVRVKEDMNPGDSEKTTIVITNTTENPILLFEGS